MKLRVAGRRGQTIGREKVRMVQVDRWIETTARRVMVNNLNIFADRTGIELLPWDFKCHPIKSKRSEATGNTRIKCVCLETTNNRLRRLDCRRRISRISLRQRRFIVRVDRALESLRRHLAVKNSP